MPVDFGYTYAGDGVQELRVTTQSIAVHIALNVPPKADGAVVVNWIQGEIELSTEGMDAVLFLDLEQRLSSRVTWAIAAAAFEGDLGPVVALREPDEDAYIVLHSIVDDYQEGAALTEEFVQDLLAISDEEAGEGDTQDGDTDFGDGDAGGQFTEDDSGEPEAVVGS